MTQTAPQVLDHIPDFPSWTAYDFIPASVGGFLIGTAATLHFGLNGKLNGMGGVVDAFTGKGANGNFGWKFSYFAGLIVSTMTVYLSLGRQA